MRAHRESSADRVWKEKLESCGSPREGIVVLILMAVLLAGMLVA